MDFPAYLNLPGAYTLIISLKPNPMLPHLLDCVYPEDSLGYFALNSDDSIA